TTFFSAKFKVFFKKINETIASRCSAAAAHRPSASESFSGSSAFGNRTASFQQLSQKPDCQSHPGARQRNPANHAAPEVPKLAPPSQPNLPLPPPSRSARRLRVSAYQIPPVVSLPVHD